VLEYPIHADFALIKAERGDRWGNLTYRMTARNFGPIMATAARCTVASVHEVVELGALDPEAVVTPGIFVQRVVRIVRAPARRPRLLREVRGHERTMHSAGPANRWPRAWRATSPTAPWSTSASGCRRWWPTTCRRDREVMLHSENGVIGMGPAPAEGAEDYDLINAGKQPVTLLPGGCFFHHADSFAMMRGGHLDICVLGAFQVSAGGDLANWHTGAPDAIPAVGGAMDLAIGAKQTWVMMEHLHQGRREQDRGAVQLPADRRSGCVSRIYTDLAVSASARPARRRPGDFRHERVAGAERYHPLPDLLWALALQGPRQALLAAIPGDARYRLAAGLDAAGLPRGGAVGPALARLRAGSASLRDMSAWPGMSLERASRMLNGLYLTGGLIVLRHPDAGRREASSLWWPWLSRRR
jgi:3-oxoacid CoA-transferase B subunit